ncbi:hypothetical protein [Streptomyces syringium]|uniref:hypothetical protein n=1 Tax=Streptomyces syringium TaxID=76729 RepID=UPI0033D47182
MDYVAGWREATGVLTELAEALAAAGLKGPGVRLRAGAEDDGAGVVRLELTLSTARRMTRLAEAAALHLGRAS